MKFESLLTIPFMEALQLIVEGAVEKYLDRSSLLKAIAVAAKKDGKNESDSLDAHIPLCCMRCISTIPVGLSIRGIYDSGNYIISWLGRISF